MVLIMLSREDVIAEDYYYYSIVIILRKVFLFIDNHSAAGKINTIHVFVRNAYKMVEFFIR